MWGAAQPLLERIMMNQESLFRPRSAMRVESYHPSHPATDAPVGERGEGTLVGTWIACEEPGATEGWLTSGIELVMDSRLEPGAVIGRHEHSTTEELYVLLEGSLTVTASDPAGRVSVMELAPGDAHRLPPGGAHSARAGAEGARLFVVAARAGRP